MDKMQYDDDEQQHQEEEEDKYDDNFVTLLPDNSAPVKSELNMWMTASSAGDPWPEMSW